MSRYRIQTVAQLTGLSAAVIRAWEARYRLVVPARTEAGYRLYSDEDVAVLRAAQHLTAHGIAPMQVAALGRPEILRLASQIGDRGPAPAGAGPAEDRAELIPGEAEPPASGAPLLFGPHIQQLVEAFVDFDRARVEQLLAPALATLPPEMACEQLLLPLLREVGDRWHRGQLSVAVEHFGTGIVRGKLLALLETLRHNAGGRRVLCACPPGEWHEIGLLMFALQASSQGWEVIYLGANLPTDGLAQAAQRSRPDVVALSIAQRSDGAALRTQLQAARAALPPGVPLLVGGRGVQGREELLSQIPAQMLPPSGRLDDLLR